MATHQKLRPSDRKRLNSKVTMVFTLQMNVIFEVDGQLMQLKRKVMRWKSEIYVR